MSVQNYALCILLNVIYPLQWLQNNTFHRMFLFTGILKRIFFVYFVAWKRHPWWRVRCIQIIVVNRLNRKTLQDLENAYYLSITESGTFRTDCNFHLSTILIPHELRARVSNFVMKACIYLAHATHCLIIIFYITVYVCMCEINTNKQVVNWVVNQPCPVREEPLLHHCTAALIKSVFMDIISFRVGAINKRFGLAICVT